MDFIYLPYTQHGTRALTVLAESNAPDAAVVAPVLRDVVRKIDPAMPYSDARTMQDFFTQRAVKTTNIIVDVVSSLGLMGLLLRLTGDYKAGLWMCVAVPILSALSMMVLSKSVTRPPR